MSVPITGTITPYPGGTYAVIDPQYGIDGWRSVADHAARDAIASGTPLRCRQGMAVFTVNDNTLWYLNTDSPAGTDADWTAFSSPGTITLSGDASGTGTSAVTVTVSSYDGGTDFGTMAAQNASDVDITGGTITGLPTPANPSDAVPKSYVDALTTSFSARNACEAATTANLSATYSNGSSGVGATLTNSGAQAAFAVDGYSGNSGDRILVKNQTTAADNGIYSVTTVGTGSTNWVLTRVADFNQADNISAGCYTVIVNGTINAETVWVETQVGPFTLGTTAIVFTEIAVGALTTTLTGDVTGTGSGTITTTIANGVIATAMLEASAVTYAKLQDESAGTLLGNPSGSSAAPSEISLGSGLAFSGTELVATGSGGTITSITAGVGLSGGTITTSGTISLATIPNLDLLANSSGGVATPGATSLTTLIDAAIGDTQGDILYRSGGGWTVLSPGSDGDVLTTAGSGANPFWGSAGGAGTVIAVDTGTGLTGGPITDSGTISLANIATGTVLANLSGISEAPSAATPTAVLDTIGSTQGNILFRGTTGWTVLAPGTSGYYLETQGVGENPQWSEPSGGSGTVTSIATANGITGGTITSSGTIGLATIAAGDLLANTTGGAAAPSGVTLTSLLDDVITSSAGSVLYRGSSAWEASSGSLGQVLTAASAGVTWSTPVGGGTETANTVYAGPSSGSAADPTFRALVAADLPTTGLEITSHYGAIVVPSGTSGTITLDLATGDWQAPAAATGNFTLALSSSTVGQQFTVVLEQAASGGPYAVTWFSGITWVGAPYTAPTMPATASAYLVATFKCLSSGVYLGWWLGNSAA